MISVPSSTAIRCLMLWWIIASAAFGAAAQEKLQSLENLRFVHYEPRHRLLIRVYDDHYILSGPRGDSAVSIAAPGLNKMVRGYSFHWLWGKLTLLKNGSGPVYQVSNGKIERIDRALDHQFQSHALEFVYRDTLFRHGGYGLWEAHRNLTYFSPSSREWEIYLPIKSDAIPPGLFQHTGHLVGNELYIYSGYTINPYNRTEKIFNREVWKFDFTKLTWSYAGELTDQLTEAVIREQKGLMEYAPKRIFYFRNQMVITEPGINHAEIFQFDPVTFKSEAFTPDPILLNDTIYSYQNGNYSAAYVGGQTEDEIINSKLDYIRTPLRSIQGRTLNAGPMMLHGTKYGWWLLTVVPALILSLAAWRRRTRRKTISSSDKAVMEQTGIRVNGISYQLNPTGLAVLQLLLSRTDDVPSAEVLAITSPHEPSYPNQVRIKNRLIRTLNLELRSIFRTENDIICQTDSAVDRRIKCYRIDRSFFQSSESISE